MRRTVFVTRFHRSRKNQKIKKKKNRSGPGEFTWSVHGEYTDSVVIVVCAVRARIINSASYLPAISLRVLFCKVSFVAIEKKSHDESILEKPRNAQKNCSCRCYSSRIVCSTILWVSGVRTDIFLSRSDFDV